MPLENICLFNRDALLLWQLKYAIKHGDVGAILDICTHLMVMFQGTGQMPKYVDALFHYILTIVHGEAWLMNWLANLSGKVNGFKELDLLHDYNLGYMKGTGQTCGEEIEASWSHTNPLAVSICKMGPGACHEILNDHWMGWNFRKVVGLSMSTDFLMYI